MKLQPEASWTTVIPQTHKSAEHTPESIRRIYDITFAFIDSFHTPQPTCVCILTSVPFCLPAPSMHKLCKAFYALEAVSTAPATISTKLSVWQKKSRFLTYRRYFLLRNVKTPFFTFLIGRISRSWQWAFSHSKSALSSSGQT